LPLAGETFAGRLARLFREAGCTPVILVLGHDAESVRHGLGPEDADTIVVNPDYARGQLSSLQCGLSAVPEDAAGFLFTPVDHAAVRPSTVAEIVRRFAGRSDELVVVPQSGGRRGHPVCCARELIPEFLSLPAGGAARDVVHRHRDRTACVEVNDPGIHEDADDPEAYRRLSSAPLRP
jgi:molybdenum cofactor cytidylyltransferase